MHSAQRPGLLGHCLDFEGKLFYLVPIPQDQDLGLWNLSLLIPRSPKTGETGWQNQLLGVPYLEHRCQLSCGICGELAGWQAELLPGSWAEEVTSAYPLDPRPPLLAVPLPRLQSRLHKQQAQNKCQLWSGAPSGGRHLP